MIENLEQHQKEWYDENAPFGRQLGYPECCIKAFCDDPPILLRQRKITEDDRRRYKAGCINGVFTGFIPCAHHAYEIVTGQILLASLIKDRNPEFPPFPDL